MREGEVSVESIGQTAFTGVAWPQDAKPTPPEAAGSTVAQKILDAWHKSLPKFVKVLPKDYKRVLEAEKRVRAQGLSGEEATMAAFRENVKDLARVAGN